MNLKKIFIIFLFVLGILPSGFSQIQNQWTSIGPFGKVPGVGTSNSTIKTGNGIVNCVEVHPTDTNIVYAGTGAGVWQSSDRGNNWWNITGPQYSNGLPNSNTVSPSTILVDQSNPSNVYVSTGMSYLRLPNSTIQPIVQPYTSGIYWGNTTNGTNYTWTNISNGLPNLQQFDSKGNYVGYIISILKQDPINFNIIYAGTSYGLYKYNTQTPGAGWALVSGVPTTKLIKSIDFTNVNTTTSSCTYYIAGEGILMTSPDGTSWTSLLGTCTNCIDITNSYYTSNIGGSATYSTYYLSASKKYPNKIYISLLTANPTSPIQRYILSYDGTTMINLRQKYDANNQWIGWGYFYLGSSPTNFEPVITSVYRDPTKYNSPISSNEYIVMAYEYIEGLYEDGSGGFTYFNNQSGYSTSSCPNSHADIRYLKTSQNNRYVYCATDGMLSRFNILANSSNITQCGAWEQVDNNNLIASSVYDVSVSTDGSLIFAGLQDDGNIIYEKNKAGTLSSGGWQSYGDGGDGGNQVVQGGYAFADINGGGSGYSRDYQTNQPGDPILIAGPNLTFSQAHYYKKLFKDPQDTTVIYSESGSSSCPIIKNETIYKIKNGILNCNNLILNASTIWQWSESSAFAIAPSNNNCMYIAFSAASSYVGDLYNASTTKMYKTTIGGGTCNTCWPEIILPTANANDRLIGIAVSDVDPLTVFIAYNNASNNRPRVYMSNDGGRTWADYHNSLGAFGSARIHSILYVKGSNDELYVGTDNGAYYTNRQMVGGGFYGWWTKTNLPPAPVLDLEYCVHTNLIYASTWGAGIWQVNPSCNSNGNLTITDANIDSYHSPSIIGSTQGVSIYTNGTITYTSAYDGLGANNYFDGTNGGSIELKSNISILFGPGTYYSAGYGGQLTAFLGPCSGGNSTLRKADGITSISNANNSLGNFKDTVLTDPINIYPNPSMGEVKLAVELKEEDKAIVQVFNMQGIEIYSAEMSGSNQILDMDLTGKITGTYLVKITKNNKEVYTRKLILGIMKTSDRFEEEYYREKPKNNQPENKK